MPRKSSLFQSWECAAGTWVSVSLLNRVLCGWQMKPSDIISNTAILVRVLDSLWQRGGVTKRSQQVWPCTNVPKGEQRPSSTCWGCHQTSILMGTTVLLYWTSDWAVGTCIVGVHKGEWHNYLHQNTLFSQENKMLVSRPVAVSTLVFCINCRVNLNSTSLIPFPSSSIHDTWTAHSNLLPCLEEPTTTRTAWRPWLLFCSFLPLQPFEPHNKRREQRLKVGHFCRDCCNFDINREHCNGYWESERMATWAWPNVLRWL